MYVSFLYRKEVVAISLRFNALTRDGDVADDELREQIQNWKAEKLAAKRGGDPAATTDIMDTNAG